MIELVVDDLARQVAQKSVESANWRARALQAEKALAEAREAAEDETAAEEGQDVDPEPEVAE